MMKWLGRHRNNPEQNDSAPREFPARLALVPGELAVQVHRHPITTRDGLLPCWSYVTDGLWAKGQKELILTLRHPQGAAPLAFPRLPLSFFRGVLEFARQGRLVDVGQFSEFGPPGFLEDRFRAIVYVPPQPLQDVALPQVPCLAAILLTGEEAAVAKTFGASRVLARLGQAHSHYPYPVWSDLARAALSHLHETMQASLLAKTLRMGVRGAQVALHQPTQRIVLRLLSGIRPELQPQLETIPPNAVLGLLTEIDRTANACLYWVPGQGGPTAITAPLSDASRIAGCFLAFVPEQPADGGRILEDGFAMMLTDESWGAVRAAMAAGEAITVPAAGDGLSFSLEWIEQTYHNPVDGMSYYAEGGWTVCGSPAPPTGTDFAPLSRLRCVLLNSDEELKARVSVEAFSDYFRAIQAIVQGHFAALAEGPGLELIIQFEVGPDRRVELGLALRPPVEVEDLRLRDLHGSLLALPAPPVSHGPIRFQLCCDIWGGPAHSPDGQPG